MITPRGRQINAMLAALLAYVLARGLILVAIIPAWQGTDEPGHFEYALLLSSRAAAIAGLAPDRSVHNGTAAQAPIVRSLREHSFYRYTASKVPPLDAARFEDVPRLGTEVAQRGDETPIGYLPYAAALAVVPDGDVAVALRRLRLVSIALVLILALIAWRVAARVLPRHAASAVAALVVVGPMVGFAGSIVSPDLVAATLVAAWLAVTERRFALMGGDSGARSDGIAERKSRVWVPKPALTAWVLVFLAAAAKRTALFVVPLAVMAELLASRNRTSTGRGRRSARVSLGIALFVVAALGLGLTVRRGDAAGWKVAGTPWGDVRSASAAREGGWGLRIFDAAPDGWHYIERFVEIAAASASAPAPNVGRRVAASAWIRRSPVETSIDGREGMDLDATAGISTDAREAMDSDAPVGISTDVNEDMASDAPTRASLVVDGGADVWLAELVDLPADGTWQQVSVRGVIATDLEGIRIAIVPGDGTIGGVGAIDADEVTLRLDGVAMDINGGAETPTRRGTVWVESLMRYTSAERLLHATRAGIKAPGAALERGVSALAFTFRSAWGGYGWLTLWPGSVHYGLAALLTLAAIAGCAAALFAPKWLVRDQDAARFFRLCAVGAIIAVAAAIVGSVAGAEAHKQPQGRYLIPALLPIALPTAALAERIAPGRGPLVLAALAFWLDLAAIGWVIWPGFQ